MLPGSSHHVRIVLRRSRRIKPLQEVQLDYSKGGEGKQHSNGRHKPPRRSVYTKGSRATMLTIRLPCPALRPAPLIRRRLPAATRIHSSAYHRTPQFPHIPRRTLSGPNQRRHRPGDTSQPRAATQQAHAWKMTAAANIISQLPARFEKARASGGLLYYDSTVHTHKDSESSLEVRAGASDQWPDTDPFI